MLNDRICKLREELNNSIITGQDYEVTYELSIKLDKLIAEYYQTQCSKISKQKTNVTKAKKPNKLICY